MEIEKDSSLGGEYPYNLLLAIKGQADRVVPENLTDDHLAGLNYALSTLEERERNILLQRYRDKQSRSKIAIDLNIILERVRQIEIKACRKPQRYPYWNYISLGVAGYVKKVASSEYNRGYSTGYEEGYRDGSKDGANGITNSYASHEILNQPIESLNLSVRALNCLKIADCKRVGDVVRLSDEKISTMRQLGKISANEIAQALKALNITHSAWEKYLL